MSGGGPDARTHCRAGRGAEGRAEPSRAERSCSTVRARRVLAAPPLLRALSAPGTSTARREQPGWRVRGGSGAEKITLLTIGY